MKLERNYHCPPEVDSYLRERAPIAIGDGPDATKRAAVMVAGKISPKYRIVRSQRPTLAGFKIFHSMRSAWLPRCSPPLSENDLNDVIAEVTRDYEAAEERAKAEKLARSLAQARAWGEVERQRVAAADAIVAKRRAHAEQVDKLISALGVGRRQAQRLLQDGTKLPEQAKAMAAALGTDERDHLKRKGHSGREPDLVGRFMRGWVKGCTWRDYIEEAPPPEGEAGRFFETFASRYRDSIADVPDHFLAFEDLVRYANGDFELSALTEIWTEYQVWRIRTMADKAILSIKPAAVALDFDFG